MNIIDDTASKICVALLGACTIKMFLLGLTAGIELIKNICLSLIGPEDVGPRREDRLLVCPGL
jgi:hypothetical protein